MRRLRSGRTEHLALLVLLTLSAALFGPPAAEPAQAQSSSAQTVPADWTLIPDGVEPGDSFRLLFVTSTSRDATSADIADYNAHVQSAADANAGLKPFKDGFTALISTASVNIKDNSATTGTGLPVHWLGGDKLADDYADLYDLSWDSVSGKTETGGSYTGLVWTGGNGRGATSLRSYAGAAQVRMADLGDARPLSSPTTKASSESYPLYALSSVLTVAQPEPEPTPTPTPTPAPTPEPESGPPAITAGPLITSNPASGDTYGAGEAIVVAVTFSEAVTVTGQPQVRVSVGERQRRARYDHSRQDGTVLVFTYQVKKVDADQDGIGIGANRLALNGGSIADADGNAAILTHPALAAQAGHKVDGSRKAAPADRPGVVSLLSPADPPAVGDELTATLLDPDGGVSGPVWSWQRSADGSAWDNVSGASGASYTLAAEDGSHYLRATASYADAHGAGKTAASAAVGPVAATVARQEPETQAQTTTEVWSATLTVGAGDDGNAGNGYCLGADNTHCGYGSLNDDDFTLDSTNYKVESIRWGQAAGQYVHLTLDRDFPADSLSVLTLQVGTHTFALSNAVRYTNPLGDVIPSNNYRWSEPSGWTDPADGATVTVKILKAQAATTAPAKPTGLTATAGDARVALAWTDPSDSTITKYQYLQKTGNANWPSIWMDIPTSAPGETNAASYTVTSLTNGTAYQFRIRAVNAAGNSPQSEATTAVTPAAPVKPKVTLVLGSSSIAESGSGNATTVKATLAASVSSAVTVTLSSAPTGKVAFGSATVVIPADGTESPTTTVTAVDNDVDAADASVTISGAPSGTAVTAPDDVALTVTDDDTKGVTVSATTVMVAEGATAEYTVKLDSEPTANVVITPTSGDTSAATVSTAATNDTLTFTPSNWSTAQTVTVTGVDDADRADESVTVTHAVGGSGSGYGRVTAASVAVTVTDNDPPAKPTGLTATAGDARVALSWTDPGDSTITKYQYLQKTGNADWPTDWVDIPTSAPGETNAASYTVTSLTNGTAYQFRIRAVNAAGNSAQSEATTAVTPAAPVTATLELVPAFISENGGVARVTASLPTAVSADTVITVSAAPVSPAVTTDFTLSANVTLTIPAGETESTGVVTITAVDNSVTAANKTLTVSGASGNSAVASTAGVTLLIAEDDYECADSTAIGSTSTLESDCEALLASRDVLRGTANLNWSTDLAIGSWRGVTVTGGRVTTLGTRLAGFASLNGSIPAQLGALSALEELYLQGGAQSLTGSIPAALGSLSNLNVLDLKANDLSGPIPAALDNLDNLERVYLQENALSGAIPSALGGMEKLRELSLQENHLTGSIPAALGNLPSLENLRLHDNALTGSIPAALGNLEYLSALRLQNNRLTGGIPGALGSLSRLTYLNLSNNNLAGELPRELGSLKRLQTMYLDRNRLTGMIPAEYAALTRIVPFGDALRFHSRDSATQANKLTGKVTLTVTPNLVAEAGGAKTVTVSASLDPGTAWAGRDSHWLGGKRYAGSTVTVSVAGGTATSGTDYTAVEDFTFEIPQGQRSATATFTLTPTTDSVTEAGNETVTVSATGKGALGPGGTTGIALSAANTPAITIVDAATSVNAAPIFDEGSQTTRSVRENTAAGTVIGAAFSATDPESDTLTYALGGADASSFDWDADKKQIKVKADLDYESKNTYTVEVTVHDGKNGSGGADTTVDATIVVTVDVIDVNEDGAITLAPGAPVKGTALTASLSDEDAPIGHVVWTWERLEAVDSTAGAAIDAAGVTVASDGMSSSYTPVAADVGKYLRATASYTDAFRFNPRGFRARAAGVTETAVLASAPASNAAPTFTSSATFTAAENATAVGTVAASDSDSADSIESYAITAGADQAKFSIVASTGVLTFKTAPDFENPTDAASTNPSNAASNNQYVLVVTATSGAGDREMTATQTVIVTVTDVNEAPTVSGNAAVNYAENGTAAVATYSASDPDAGATHTWTLEGADGGAFEISSAGELTFKTAPDFENPADGGTDNVYNVTVKATDNGSPGLSATRAVTVTVTDVNEAPAAPDAPAVTAVPGSSTSLEVTWTAPANTGPAITDYDWRWKLQSETTWTEKTDTTTTATTATIPELTASTAYHVQVRATNDEGTGGWSASGNGTTGAAPNAAPAFTSSATFNAQENQTSVGTVIASDADTADDVESYAITGGADQAKFSIVASTGVLTFKTAPDFEDPTDATSANPSNAATNNEYVLVVTATSGTDARAMMATQTITVTVTNVNEAGAVTFGSTEPQAGTALVATLSDPDGSVGDLTWAWERLDAASSSSGAAITGATSANLSSRYTPVAADVGKWLWATASYTDAANADATNKNSAGEVTAAVVAAAAPSVSTIAVTSDPGDDDTYAVGDVIAVTVTFDQAIAVTGTPTLTIKVGTAEKTATCAAHATETDKLVCSYTVAEGDSDAGGIEVEADKLAGTIKNAANTDAALTYTALPAQAGHKVDGVAPGTPTAVALASGTASPGRDSTPDITVTVAETGGKVTLYRDSTCTTAASAAVSVSDTTSPFMVTVTASALSSSGAVSFYARHVDAFGNASACSTVHAGYSYAKPRVTLVLSPASIGENAGVSTVTATLDTAVPSATTITVSATPIAPGVASDYTLSQNTTLTIAANATSSTGAVTITAVDNAVDAADKTVTVSGSVANTAVDAPEDVTLTITDNDTKGVTLSVSSLTVAEGGTGTYTVKLDSQPAGDVTVTPSSDNSDVTFAPATLTFTTSDYGTAQTVTVSAAGDDDTTDDTATISHAVDEAGDNAPYDSVTAGAVMVTVTDDDDAEVNAAPTFTSSASFDAAENSTAVGTVIASDADTADDIESYAITAGADQAKFSIVADTGVLTFKAAPDFEDRQDVLSTNPSNAASNNEYVLVVTATSGTNDRAMTTTQTITVTVTDVVEPPSAPDAPTVSAISGSSTSLRVTWTAPANTGPAITDYDWRWKLQSASTWTAKTDTTTTATTTDIGSLTASTAYHVQVRATNDEGTSGWSASGSGTTAPTLTAPAAPTDLTAAKDGRFAIDLSWTAPGAASTRAAATGYEIQWSADGSNGWTDLATISSAATLTYEDSGLAAATTRHYRVRATSSAGAGAWSTSASATTDANAAPVFDPDTQSRSVAENSAVGTNVGAAIPEATDADGDALTYALGGADKDFFTFDAAAREIKVGEPDALDYENPPTIFSVTVTATDGHGGSSSVAVTISVTNVDEPGRVQLGAHPEVGTPLEATLSDQDGSVASVTWQWAKANTKGGTYTDIPGATSVSYTPVAGDAGAWLRATASYTDGHGMGKSAALIAPKPVAAASPTVTAGSTAYYGDAALMTPLTGTQGAGTDIYTKVTFSKDMKHVKSNAVGARPELFFSIGRGADRRYHILDHGDTLASGDCKPTHATNTNVYVCLYTVGGENTGAFRLKVGTNSVDEADNALASAYTHAASLTLDTTRPTVTAASTGYYGEAALTTALTGAQSAGTDIYTKVTFSEDMKQVASDTTSARPQLYYRIGTTDTQYDILAPGGTLASGDCKPNHASETDEYVCLYTVGGSDSGAFSVRAGTGSEDKAGNALASAYTHAETLTLSTPNAAPTFTSSATFNAVENQTPVGTVTASDSDSADSIESYAITGGADQAKFSITNGGVLTFQTAPNFEDPQDALSTNPSNAATNNEYVLVVTVTSGTGGRAMTATQTITVHVTDVNEAPDAPDAPTVSAVSGSATSLKVTWTAPANTGPAITDYDWRWKLQSASEWTAKTDTTTTATTATIPGLTANTAYHVQVRATNDEGTSGWSASGSGTPGAAPNDVPRNLTATPSSTSATLRWDPPIIQGEQASGLYRIRWRTADPAGQWQQTALNWIGSKPEYIVQSLQPETKYDFEVTYIRTTNGATRYAGSASEQATTNPFGSVSFDAATPWAGTALTATLADESGSVSGLTWTWERLESADSKSGTMIGSGLSSAYIPTEADQGQWLRATASYTDAHGSSRSAQAVTTNSVKMATVIYSASAPRVSTIAVTSTPMQKSTPGIANPDTYGKGETIEVTVTLDQAVNVTGAPSLQLDIGGSRAAAAYARGSGSAALVFTYPVVDPNRDDNGVSVPGIYPIVLPSEASIQSAGGEDADLRHSGIGDQSGHKVYSPVAGGSRPRIKSIDILSTPTSGTTYGAGETIVVQITWDQLVRGLNRPYPTLALSFGSGETTSSRTALMAISQGDKSRFRYVVQASDADTDGISIPQNPLTVPRGSFVRNHGNSQDAILTYAGLSAQSGHKVDGSADNVRPLAPRSLRVSGHVTIDREPWISVSWHNRGDQTITGYQYQQDNGAWRNIPDSGPDTSSHRITSGVVEGVGHRFRVRAVDAGGAGAASAAVTVTWHERRPFQPEGLRAVAGDGQVTLSWTDGDDPSITRYEYQQRRQWLEDGARRYTTFDSWTAVPGSGAETVSHIVSGLENGTTYYFRIRAVNAIGNSPYSRAERATPAAATAE